MQNPEKSNTFSPNKQSEYHTRALLHNPKNTSYLKNNFPELLPLYNYIHDAEINLLAIWQSFINLRGEQRNKAQKQYDLQKDKAIAQIEQLVDDLPFSKNKIDSQVCNRKVLEYYSCEDCGADNSYCVDCFDYKAHHGHLFRRNPSKQIKSMSFCACGNNALLDRSKWCQKHRDAQLSKSIQENRCKLKTELGALLELGIVAFSRIRIQHEPSDHPLQLNCQFVKIVIRCLSNLLQKYQLYQQILPQIVIGQSSLLKGTLLEHLIRTHIQLPNFSCSETEDLLATLSLNAKFAEKLLMVTLKECSLSEAAKYGEIKSLQQSMFNRLLRLVMRSHQRYLHKWLVKPADIRILYPQKNTYQPYLRFYYNFYSDLLQVSPQTSCKIFTIFLDKLTTQEWVQLLQKYDAYIQGPTNKQIRAESTIFVTKLFSNLYENISSSNAQIVHEMLVNLASNVMISFAGKNLLGWKVLGRLFTLSLLLSSDFSPDKMHVSFVKIAENLSAQYQSSHLLETLLLIYHLTAGTINDSSKESYAEISEKYITLFMIEQLMEKLKLSQNLYSSQSYRCFDHIEQFNRFHHYSKVTSLRVNTRYIDLPILILQAQLSNKYFQKVNIVTFYRELATIYTCCSKSQFKQRVKLFIDKPHDLQNFIVKEFQHFKSGKKVVKSFKYHIPFSSLLIRHESNLQKAKRWEHQNQLIYEWNQVQKIAQNYLQYVKQFYDECQKQNSTIFYLDYFDTYFQTLLTLHLSVLNSLTSKRLKSLYEVNSEYCLLSLTNENILKLYISKKGIVLNIAESKPQQDDKFKKSKQMKMKALKQRQQTILKANEKQNPYLPSQSEQQLCILCGLGSRHDQPLYYLCLIRKSNILKNMYNSDHKFMLFTSCGHAVHELCLANALPQQKIQYWCFYCRERSNANIPTSLENYDSKRLQQLYGYLMSVLSLQIAQSGNSVDSNKQQQMTKDKLFEEIYKSIIQQIYSFYLVDSQLFNRCMFQVISQLISILSSYRRQQYNQMTYPKWAYSKIAGFFLKPQKDQNKSIIPQKTSYADTLYYCIDVLTRADFSLSTKKKNILGPNQREDSTSENIRNLCLQFLDKGHPPPLITQYKCYWQYRLFEPPKYLSDLNRLTGKCDQCSKVTNHIRICFICKRTTCQDCQNGAWKGHIRNKYHQGATASINAANGMVWYENIKNKARFKCIYRNAFEEEYPQEVKQVKDEDPKNYTRDEAAYEKVVRDVVLRRSQ